VTDAAGLKDHHKYSTINTTRIRTGKFQIGREYLVLLMMRVPTRLKASSEEGPVRSRLKRKLSADGAGAGG
jgi:hypothetical protein